MQRSIVGRTLTAIAITGALLLGALASRPSANAAGELTPNGGRFAAGANAAVWRETGGATSAASAVAQAAASAAPGLDVIAVWVQSGGEWKYHLPRVVSASTLQQVGPLVSLFVVLEAAGGGGAAGSSLAAGIVERINSTRQAQGLAPLRTTPELTASAEKYARFLHDAGYPNVSGDPHALDGTVAERVRREGYAWRSVGEVLAYHSGVLDLASEPEAFLQLWLNSPPHRAILLGDYADIGIGCHQVASGRMTRITCAGNLGTR